MKSAGLRTTKPLALALLFLLASAGSAHAYIGPGAGFAFIGSFFVMFMAALAAAVVLLMWPVRVLIFFLRKKKGYAKTDVGRVVVVGLDGLDPKLVRKYLDEGRLPNFERLMEAGSFQPLETTCPSISPVAWSSFTTGLTPARHGIFDFLDRDLKTYMPVLSSAKIGGAPRHLKLGRYRIPIGKPPVRLLRKGVPFWHYLGDVGVSCSVLRVPITFPPEKFEGRLLSAMCTPDLRGTQGTFSCYTTAPKEKDRREGGQVYAVKLENGRIKTDIVGPHNPFVEGSPAVKIPVEVRVDSAKKSARFILPDTEFTLTEGVYSDWANLAFPMAPMVKARGIARFLVTSFEPFSFYVTPVNIDPEDPALPISHPKTYSVYLGKLMGSHATLGLAEDTWALNEKVIDDQQFLDQAWLIHKEREAMLMNELENVAKGLVVCVFDITDRAQHMFWKYTDPGHPALEGGQPDKYAHVIGDVYAGMDAMVGRVMGKLSGKDILLVMSDHGFCSFRRGVNLNSWLHESGYLALKDGAAPSDNEWFHSVDWERTTAYAVGLGGICINTKGRESRGTVSPGADVQALKDEIAGKLTALMDTEKDARPVRNVYDLKRLYKGPYLDNGPDLFVGFDKGYRVSWECAKGVVDGKLFKDNIKSWSGDHCTDYAVVPGVLISNRNLKADGRAANIIDIAPTVIKAFGLDVPKHMEGSPLL
jgi:predicted AlkP superfamily phosphohydrolase/phosphomutase